MGHQVPRSRPRLALGRTEYIDGLYTTAPFIIEVCQQLFQLFVSTNQSWETFALAPIHAHSARDHEPSLHPSSFFPPPASTASPYLTTYLAAVVQPAQTRSQTVRGPKYLI